MLVEVLAGVQFGLTCAFHYLFPPISNGLELILALMELSWLRSGDDAAKRLTHFWVEIFSLVFGLGVATGIVLKFEFGTNWASYSRYVGDIFGSVPAAKGVFAFFLKSGFLAILVFGWHMVSLKSTSSPPAWSRWVPHSARCGSSSRILNQGRARRARAVIGRYRLSWRSCPSASWETAAVDRA